MSKTQVGRQYAGELLDRLIELDATISAAYFDLGRILSAIEHSKLYDILDYSSLGHLIDEELSFTPATGFKYMRVFRKLRQLKYTKQEALSLFQDHSFTRVSDVLSTLTTKVGTRAMATRIAGLDQHQINFTLTESEYTELVSVLKSRGAIVEHGRLQHSTDALLSLIRNNFRQAA